MGWFGRIFGGRDRTSAYAPVYAAVVAVARRPFWYAQGHVADTLDGRFDMVSSVLALVLIRLGEIGEGGREPAARLTELFIADMDGQLRQDGIGDVVVGKHIGRMMSQLGGRLEAYRDALAPGGDLGGALDRNVHRLAAASAESQTLLVERFRALSDDLARRDLAAVLAGDIA